MTMAQPRRRRDVDREAPDEPGRAHAEAGLPEPQSTLWLLTAGPTTWALHLLLSYVTAAVWCAKAGRTAPLGDIRLVIAGYTVVALAAITVFGWRGLRQHRLGSSTLPHDAPTAADRHRFLGFSTLLLCGLSFVAVLYEAIAIAVIGSCR
jgi:hypothetical protein